MEDELADYETAQYVSPKKARAMSTTTAKKPAAKKPLDKPASTAASAAPFSIVSGVKKAQKWYKIFLYAKYGHGKTVLSAQAVDIPRMRDVIFINVEGGTKSILGSEAVENHELIDFVPSEGSIADFETFVAIHRMLLSYCQARDDNDTERLERMAAKYGFDPAKRYRTVIIDSLSELNSVSLSRAFGEKADDLLQVADSDDTRRDYGRNRQSMTKVLRAFRNLPMHVIVTCGADWDKNENDRDRRPKYYPRLTGALAQEVQGYWDVVGFLYSPGREKSDDDEESENKPADSRLYLQPGKFWDAKNRLANRSVRHLDDPSMSKLISLITNEKSPQGEKTPQKPKKA